MKKLLTEAINDMKREHRHLQLVKTELFASNSEQNARYAKMIAAKQDSILQLEALAEGLTLYAIPLKGKTGWWKVYRSKTQEEMGTVRRPLADYINRLNPPEAYDEH